MNTTAQLYGINVHAGTASRNLRTIVDNMEGGKGVWGHVKGVGGVYSTLQRQRGSWSEGRYYYRMVSY